MEKVRLGIIGAGNMGSGHIGNYPEAGKCPEIETHGRGRPPAGAPRLGQGRRCPMRTAIFAEGSDLIASRPVRRRSSSATPHYQHPTLAIEGFAARPARALRKARGRLHQAGAGDERRPPTSTRSGLRHDVQPAHQLRLPQDARRSSIAAQLGRARSASTGSSPTGIARRATMIPARGAPPGPARAAACCSTSARTSSTCVQWICGMPSKVQRLLQGGQVARHRGRGRRHRLPASTPTAQPACSSPPPATPRHQPLRGHAATWASWSCENDEAAFYKNEVLGHGVLPRPRPNGFATAPSASKIEVETDGCNLQHVEVSTRFAGADPARRGRWSPTGAGGHPRPDPLQRHAPVQLAGRDRGHSLGRGSASSSELNKRRATSRRKGGQGNHPQHRGLY